MAMKGISNFCAALFICLSQAHADLGEKRAWIEARLGHSIDSAGRQRLYRAKETFCLVTYGFEISEVEHRFKRLTPEQSKKLVAPPPPFPSQSHPIGEGIGLYEFTFDDAGHFSKGAIVQSTNPLLDAYTFVFAREKWMGPPASFVTLAVAYHSDGEQTKVYGQ